MYWYWWVWWAVVLLLIVWIVGAWGFRGMGPPYPRYYSRRRYGEYDSRPPESSGGAYTHWGWIGDLFWLAVIGAIIWAIVWWFR